MALSTVDTEEENLVLNAIRSVMDKYSGCESVLAGYAKELESRHLVTFAKNWLKRCVKK